MRAMVNFDTLNFMESLEKSGMDAKQAEAITRATATAFAQMMETQELATKKDLRETENTLKKDIRDTESILKQDLRATESILKQNIRDTEGTLKKDILEVRKEIGELEMKMYRFIIKATMTTVGLLGALNTFFHYFPK